MPRISGETNVLTRGVKALDEAKAKGWPVVDMKKDWKRVFPWEQ